MTETETMSTLEALLRYQYAPVALQFKENPEDPGLAGCLENLARDQEVKGTRFEGYFTASMKNPESMLATAEVYAPKWKEAYDKATVGELFTYYSDAKEFKLSKYFTEGDLRIIGAKLSTLKDKKLKDINDELKEITDKLKSIRKDNPDVSEEDIRNLNTAKLMYEEAKGILNTFEVMKMQAFKSTGEQIGLGKQLKTAAGNLMKSLAG